MIRQLALVRPAPGLDPARRASLEAALGDAEAPGLLRAQLGRHLPGALGGGDYTWDAWLDDAAPPLAAWLDAAGLGGWLRGPGAAASLDAVRYRPLHGAAAEPGIRGPVKRSLLLRVLPGTPEEKVAAFERDLCAMPRHIGAIRNWALSRTDPRLHPTGWTHVWEQEYRDASGLEVDYMLHPFHWGWIDAYFDPEHPRCIVDPRVAHVYYGAAGTLLAWGP